MAEGARLESVFRGNSNVGSNPTLSAKPCSIFKIEPSSRFRVAILFLASKLGGAVASGRPGGVHSLSSSGVGQTLPVQLEWCPIKWIAKSAAVQQRQLRDSEGHLRTCPTI